MTAIKALNLDGARTAATCNFDGASHWDDGYNVFFAGKKIVVLPDNRHVALYILDVEGHGTKAALLAVVVNRVLQRLLAG